MPFQDRVAKKPIFSVIIEPFSSITNVEDILRKPLGADQFYSQSWCFSRLIFPSIHRLPSKFQTNLDNCPNLISYFESSVLAEHLSALVETHGAHSLPLQNISKIYI